MSVLGRAGATATSAAVVIAALAVGRLVSDHLESKISPDPFIREVAAGETAHLRFADIDVDRVSAADALISVSSVAKARGVFLVVDVTVRGTDRARALTGVELVDAEGRIYGPDKSRAYCSFNLNAEPGLTTYARLCFDIPTPALDGVRLLVAREDSAGRGASQRRDEIGDLDLGITPTEAERMLAANLALKTTNDPFAKPDPEPQPMPTEAS